MSLPQCVTSWSLYSNTPSSTGTRLQWYQRDDIQELHGLSKAFDSMAVWKITEIKSSIDEDQSQINYSKHASHMWTPETISVRAQVSKYSPHWSKICKNVQKHAPINQNNRRLDTHFLNNFRQIYMWKPLTTNSKKQMRHISEVCTDLKPIKLPQWQHLSLKTTCHREAKANRNFGFAVAKWWLLATGYKIKIMQTAWKRKLKQNILWWRQSLLVGYHLWGFSALLRNFPATIHC